MVWWIVRRVTQNNNMTPPNQNYHMIKDIVFQSTSIMFSFSHENYDAYDIHRLLFSGVNIFNVDLTLHDRTFYEKVKETISEAINMPTMYFMPAYIPVGLSVTMSIFDPIEIDDRTDFIILKDVLHEEDVIEFKGRNMKFSVPVLLWISKYCSEHKMELIKVADGIVLDIVDLSRDATSAFVKMCKAERKPLFFFNANIFENLYDARGGKRKLMIVASEYVESNIDGAIVVVEETEESPKRDAEIVENAVEALTIAEENLNINEVFSTLLMNTLVPQTSSKAVMFAATLAALKHEAAALIVLTVSGRSAHALSVTLPPCSIIAITAHQHTARMMHMFRKVIPVFYDGSRAVNWQEECRNRVVFGTKFALKSGLIRYGAKLVVLAPLQEGTVVQFSYFITIAI